MAARFTEKQIEDWRRDGAILIKGFFTPEEIAPVAADFETLYGERRPEGETPVDLKKDGQIGAFSRDQFKHFDDMPFACSPALNLLGLHPALIELARAALGTDDVRLYQSHSWAKFAGDADYDQDFHCDFKNHTLTVPADDKTLGTINVMIYATDVTDARGAIHYVTNPDSDPITGRDRTMFVDNATQHALKAVEHSGAAPAGSIFAYGIDVFHRGTNITEPSARRFTLTASYKAAGNDAIGWSAWPHSFLKPWHLIFDNASPEQLACVGVPRPGDPFWTARTIARTKERWPDWNAAPYTSALADRA